MTAVLTPRAFRERFALASFADGGVVVDLETGSYSRLNASGAAVLEELERAESLEAAIATIGARLGTPADVASRHVHSLAQGLAGAGIRYEPPDPFRYLPAEDGGYDVWHGQRLVLHVAATGRELALKSDPGDLPLPLYDYVSGIAPKLLFLRGVTVMHGSSCLRDGTLLGICGKSRAGKTTTAKTLARHGPTLVTQDLLVFASDLAHPTVFLRGEAHAHAWSSETTDALADRPGATADVDSLLACASGEAVPLGALWFLDARRRGTRFEARPLSRSRALELVVANHFLGAGDHPSWRHHLAASRSIASAVKAYELDLPNGLDRLGEALQRYSTNSAS